MSASLWLSLISELLKLQALAPICPKYQGGCGVGTLKSLPRKITYSYYIFFNF